MADTEEEKDTDQDLDKDEDLGEEDEDKSSHQKESDTKDKEDDNDTNEDKEEIPVRKSANASFIIQRQKKTIDNLRKGKKEEDKENDDGEGEEELTPESRSLVTREIEKHLAPIKNTLASRADEEELNNLFKDEPEAKNYEKTIRLYMKSEYYKSVPPSVIYHHLAFGEAENSGANKKRIAEKEGKMSRTKGNQKRPTKTSKGNMPSPEEIEDMDEKEFEALQNDVRQGKYLSRDEE